MATRPVQRRDSSSRPLLAAFSPGDAVRVADWVRSPQEAYWLAPRTIPPITPLKICGWGGFGREQHVLTAQYGLPPVAYGELNVLHRQPAEYWVGHILVDPQQRGNGLGRLLVCRLAERAFEVHKARRVSLVVFRDNVPAIRCYERLGFVEDGLESHYFPAYRTRVKLVRMSLPVGALSPD